ncbi:uncharacterized protein PITG_11973 [Phytophthora infestans T30-4]|uniref:Secreted RxLR effector peptide protein n=1 Tax=Phytophthora infestans (strain T30-4) TaxID=403677 RepID=D0NHN3_PHYIT|nr:uncharacterized protein PITG_11973 [Phytophthora infestans T30-4]EEY58958.1 hypothetical protein PITG_11973 [Phytophthora infestans T30-4]|eukprot:XP_002901431.1 hypothetical protein PITG_11973 [Phytophthora infestans T30-4]
MRRHLITGLALNFCFVCAAGSNVHLPNPTSWEAYLEMNENVVSGRKLLRSDGADDAGNESRTGLSVSITERLKSLFKSSNVTPEKLQSWLNSEKPADTVFMRMHLHKADDWVLQAPQFSTWLQYADPLSAKTGQTLSAAIPTLTRQLGDDKLYRGDQSLLK